MHLELLLFDELFNRLEQAKSKNAQEMSVFIHQMPASNTLTQ